MSRNHRNSEYSGTHRTTRANVARLVRGGGYRCARGEDCRYSEFVNGVWLGGLIHPGEAWDLDHTDDRRGYLGASHLSCNRAAGGRKRQSGPMKHSRVW
jgi:hypothetical protein